LDILAQRIEAKATWDDIVLPENELNLLHQIADQVERRSQVYDEWGFREKMNRGLGISALFAGESGTGKTMAAEVIANDLHLNLYRIDLSAVVSKYIGETEKNLRRLFDAAEDGGAILFFDEADALFGKRSEVKDSHDRYANIEINYLLQRMEAYRGLAVLATNMKSALDHAFLRRLRFIVNFPFPSREDRARIWQQVFPPQTPVNGVDFDHLARLNLTGGNICSPQRLIFSCESQNTGEDALYLGSCPGRISQNGPTGQRRIVPVAGSSGKQSAMNIHLHIERLILDGIDIPPEQRASLEAAVTAELTHLLGEGGLQPGLTASGAVRSVPTEGIQQSEEERPNQFGQAIARSVYRGIGQ
jgi:hypothetical protein